jgi:hypothetical protein
MEAWIRRHLRLILALGDLAMVALFVYIGQRDHDLVDPVNPLWGVLQSTLVFAAPWALAGIWLGAFPTAETFAPRAFLSRSFNAWLVTTLLGLLLRSAVLGRAVLPTVFVWATLGFGGLFVLGWRLLVAGAWRWTTRRLAARGA